MRTNEAKTLTPAELARGWVELNCECHAYVFRIATLYKLPDDAIEQCPKTGLLGCKIEVVRAMEDGR